MHIANKLRELQKQYDYVDSDYLHNGLLEEAADTLEKYEKWLEHSHNFIVQSDKWYKFVKYLEENNA